MNSYMKKAMKIAGAACAATGVVALSALVASGAAVGAVVEGFKATGNTMKTLLKEETQVNGCEASKAEEQASTDEGKVVEEQASAEVANVEEAVPAVENNESV